MCQTKMLKAKHLLFKVFMILRVEEDSLKIFRNECKLVQNNLFFA